jgi:hypothetical protein
MRQEIDQRVVGDLLDAHGLAVFHAEAFVGTELLFMPRVDLAGQALGRRLPLLRRDVKLRWIGSTDRGVDRGAGPRRVFQLRHQLVGRRRPRALERIDELRARPLPAGERRRHGFHGQPADHAGRGGAARVQSHRD